MVRTTVRDVSRIRSLRQRPSPCQQVGVVELRARLSSDLADVEGAHRGCVDLGVAVVALRSLRRDPESPRTVRRAIGLATRDWPAEHLEFDLVADVLLVATELADEVTLDRADAKRWVSGKTSPWHPSEDRWAQTDDGTDGDWEPGVPWRQLWLMAAAGGVFHLLSVL